MFLPFRHPNFLLGRPSKNGPFAWVRRFGVFRTQSHSNSKKQTRNATTTATTTAAPPPDTPRNPLAPSPARTPRSRPESGLSSTSRGRHVEHANPHVLANVHPNSGPVAHHPHGYSMSAKSAAPTIATTADTAFSDGPVSRAGTTGTGLGTTSLAEGNSIFSLPNRSNQSLTTTLTTIRSTATSAMLAAGAHTPGPGAHALPRSLHPHTYTSVTANNLLTDNASVLTLASSRRMRRNSLDTDASVRALPPSSLFSTSRESLPLVHTGGAGHGAGTIDPGSATPSYHHHRFSSVHTTLLSPDRASMSSAPVAGADSSSLRNSRILAEPIA